MMSEFDIPTPSPPRQQPAVRQADFCYKCKEPGHWSKDCPKSSTFVNLNNIDVPIIYCRCGAGPCKILVSKTDKHPGWKFYTCPAKSADKSCKFFKWCKDVKAPMCRCSAGACSINTMREGPNAGRQYYACRIPKGHGACPFFEWMDQRGGSTNFQSTEQGSGSKSSSFLTTTSDVINNTLDSGIDQLEEDFAMEEIQVQSPTTDDYSFLDNCEDVAMQEAVPLDPVPSNVSPLVAQSQINTEFSRLISTATNASTIDVQHTLGLEVLGWWGRILFQPSRSLADVHPKPFFSLPILHNKSSQQASSIEADTSNEVLEAFGKVLIVALKSMDKSDAMSELAHATFSALDRLSIDHRPVSQPVNHFISCLSRVTELESLVSEGPSSEELMEQFNVKRNHLDKISGLHEEATNALLLSDEQCRFHQDKVTRLRNKLKLIERELAIFQAENAELENRVADIAEQLPGSKDDVKLAEEALNNRQQLEAEFLEARAALEKTKNQLNVPL